MKVLVIGFGSIGRRHVQNLSECESIKEIIVYTKIKNDAHNLSNKKVSFVDSSTIQLATCAEQFRCDFAIIANETYKHMNTAITLAEKGIHLFIEKPISHTMKKIEIFKETVQQKQINVFVAYNLRFLPAIQILKDTISKNILGDLYFAHIEVGQYLPTWRPHTHYTNSYSSHTEQGGGVALDLSHEIDYMRFLFGEPCHWKTMQSKVSKLEIDSEDIFAGIYQYKSGFICHVHMDYLQKNSKREVRIVGSAGEIVCDLIKKWIHIKTSTVNKILKEEILFKIHDTYKAELRYFIETFQSKKGDLLSIDDGIKAIVLLKDGYGKQA